MPSPIADSSPSWRHSLPSTPSTPLHTTSLEASLHTHGNETSSSLSPADCRTLKKLLQDVRTASPRAPLHLGDQGKGMSVEVSVDSEGSESGCEEELRHSEKQYDYGDEAEEGYQDEDDSMDLSDAIEEIHYADGDTIEDIMNLPGRMALPAPPQDFSGFYHHEQATPQEIRDIKLRRATIEKELETELLAQQHGDMADMGHDTCDYISAVDGFRDDALHLSDDTDFRAVQEIQAEIGMRVIADEEAESELELIEAYDRRASKLFSPKAITRRASEDTPLASSSLINFRDYEPAVVQTPGGHHIDFAPNAHIADTPFVKTLRYFKEYNKDKENSPSKSRRNASLPAEIAAVAREAEKEEELYKRCEEEEEEEEEDLEQYREIDLAPMVPVMESDAAGDLITLSTPSRPRDFLIDVRQDSDQTFAHDKFTEMTQEFQSESPQDQSALDRKLEQIEDLATPSSRLCLPLEQDTEHDADAEDPDNLSDSKQKQLILYPHQPTFVTVIGMIPETLFWVTAAPVVRLANKAYETLIEKFTGLEL